MQDAQSAINELTGKSCLNTSCYHLSLVSKCPRTLKLRTLSLIILIWSYMQFFL